MVMWHAKLTQSQTIILGVVSKLPVIAELWSTDTVVLGNQDVCCGVVGLHENGWHYHAGSSRSVHVQYKTIGVGIRYVDVNNGGLNSSSLTQVLPGII